MIRKSFLFIFIFCYFPIFSQNDSIQINTSVKEKSFLKKSVVPFSLIGAGLIINYSNGSIGKENLQENIQNHLNNFHTNIDNYFQFAPAVIMYSADVLKVKSTNDVFTQTKYLAIAGLSNALITYSLKRITNEERPDGTEYSFPSGHTSNAFTMATVLHHEFKDTNSWIAYSGYVFATTTGILRVMNNRHWVSDVLVGAGVGILVTDLVYRIEPLKNWNPFKAKNTRAIISPTYTNKQFGLYANVQF